MTDTDVPASLVAALVRLQAHLPTIVKGQTARVQTDKTTYTYEYADLPDVSEEILPLLSAVGLAWTCKPTLLGGDFVLAYKLAHVSGETDEGHYPLPKSGTPQAIGAAISYARRYALCAVTGAAPKGDDDDAAGAPKARTAQRQTRPAGRQTAEPAPARSAQRARVEGPPLPGDEQNLITGPQRGKVLALFGEVGIDDRDERLDISRRVLGRADLASANALTSPEAGRLIEWLDKAKADGFTNALTDLYAQTEESR